MQHLANHLGKDLAVVQQGSCRGQYRTSSICPDEGKMLLPSNIAWATQGDTRREMRSLGERKGPGGGHQGDRQGGSSWTFRPRPAQVQPPTTPCGAAPAAEASA